VRTTLLLDDDVAKVLNQEIRSSGMSFKDAVNYFLRLGLMVARQQKRKPFVVTPRPMGLAPGLSYDSVEELLEALEGAVHI
jgi:hypothetical protein